MFHFLFNAISALVSVLVSSVLWVIFTAFMVWMIVDCATKEPKQGNERLIWIIIMVCVPYLGALIYYVFRRPQRIRAYGF
jgi:membrane protein DedA with SNARE-associated domain